jgi:hypothetical protein
MSTITCRCQSPGHLLHRGTSQKPQNLEEAWERMGKNYILELVKSTDNRVNAVLKAKGWYTHF